MNPILERLHALMLERGVNAKQVTTVLKMSSSSFTDWKNGKGSPGVEALSKLAPYFGVSLDYLILGRESNMAKRAEMRDRDFFSKFHLLPPVCQEKAVAYIDGMLDILPVSAETVISDSRKTDADLSGTPADTPGKE